MLLRIGLLMVRIMESSGVAPSESFFPIAKFFCILINLNLHKWGQKLIRVDSTGTHVNGYWGFCSSPCDATIATTAAAVQGFPTCTVASGPSAGQPCVFPWTYDGTTFSGSEKKCLCSETNRLATLER